MSSSTTSLSWLQKFFLCFLILAIIFPAWTVSRWMLADLKINTVIEQIEIWNQNREIQSIEEWELALDSIEQAIALNPGESEYYRLLGLSLEWQRFAPGNNLNQVQRLQVYRQALVPYRQAVVYRPSWPQAWVKLARIKVLAEELDGEFKQALISALQLGKNDSGIQLEVSQLALVAWSIVAADPELELAVFTNFHRGLSAGGNVRAHIQLLQNAQILGRFCQQLNINTMADSAQKACRVAIQ